MTSPATGPPATGTVPPRRAGTAAGPPESPGHVSSARPCRGPHAPPPPPAWPAPLLPPSSGPDRASCCPSPVAPRGVPVTLAAAPSLPSRPSPSHLPSRREHADARLGPRPPARGAAPPSAPHTWASAGTRHPRGSHVGHAHATARLACWPPRHRPVAPACSRGRRSQEGEAGPSPLCPGPPPPRRGTELGLRNAVPLPWPPTCLVVPSVSEPSKQVTCER